jgi:hypothetical protein
LKEKFIADSWALRYCRVASRGQGEVGYTETDERDAAAFRLIPDPDLFSDMCRSARVACPLTLLGSSASAHHRQAQATTMPCKSQMLQ